MKRKLPLVLISIMLFTLSSCIRIPENATPNGCYRFALPDPGSPDPNPPLTELYLQFWDDGTGEGGFWDSPLCESEFFTWSVENDIIVFSDMPWFSQGEFSYVEVQDSSNFILYSDANDSTLAEIHLSDAIVPRVDFSISDIIGTWSNTRGQIYTFSADTLYRATNLPTAWRKSNIPHVIETQYSEQWAVRTEGQDTIICVGYNNVLRKQ